MFLIHLYEKGDFTFPNHPVNSYSCSNKEMVLDCIYDLLNNHNSGISKIIIENDEFGDDKSVTDAQSIVNLDQYNDLNNGTN